MASTAGAAGDDTAGDSDEEQAEDLLSLCMFCDILRNERMRSVWVDIRYSFSSLSTASVARLLSPRGALTGRTDVGKLVSNYGEADATGAGRSSWTGTTTPMGRQCTVV